MSHSRFELNPDGYAFVAPSTGGERGPLLHVAVPPDAVPGDVLVDQQGSTATLYVYLGPGPDVSAPLERTTDPTSPDTGPARWAPVQAQVGSALVPTGTIRIWVPDIAYGFPDMVVTGDGAGIGFMLWLCTSPSIPAGSPDPSAPGTTGWTSVGGNTTTFRIYGSVPTYDDLPPTGSVDGELWYVIDEGSLYSWGTDDVWHNVGYIRGPEGPPGSTGAPGPAGPTGAAGPPGPTGPQGEGIHLSGSVPTSDDLPDDAAPGDSYIVEADGDMYVMGDDGQWYIMETVVGPPGTEGIQGPQGPAGPVTPMVIVEALTPPGSLPNGALYFDLDDTYAGYMNATIIEGTIAPADMVPQTLFYDLDATPPIPPTTGALFYKRGTDGALVAIGGAKGGTGATGPAGATGAEGPQGVPGTGVAAGVIQSTIRSTPDVGFLFLTGQTVANGQTLHPDLWAVIPASWKSGSSIIFPDARGRMLVGDDAGAVFTLGALAGSSSLALTNANLPPHTHAIDHDHASATTSGQSVTHTHSDTPGTARIVVGGSATGVLWNGGTNSNGNFVTTPGASVDHTHTVDLPNFTGSSGNGGFANTALVIPTPPSLVINWQIKT